MATGASGFDVIVVGGGLAGLVAASELAEAGKRVAIVEQEGPQSLGGQAFWSLGGLFMVDTPEQRRCGIRDSYDLALEDWMGTAGFDRPEDYWPRQWAEAFVGFAAGEMRAWLMQRGLKWFPVVGWAERGGWGAVGHGNSVPRFHLTWGTGPGVVEPFVALAKEAEKLGRVTFFHRHRVDELLTKNGAVVGVRGVRLEGSEVPRGVTSSRDVASDFELGAGAVIVASGGIGGNHDLVRESWPARLGTAPRFMVQGVPDHVDGRMIRITEKAGARFINRDRMWHYVEGIRNWNPIWPNHGIRILPGPSSIWLDATGKRLPPPLFPGFDTMASSAAPVVPFVRPDPAMRPHCNNGLGRHAFGPPAWPLTSEDPDPTPCGDAGRVPRAVRDASGVAMSVRRRGSAALGLASGRASTSARGASARSFRYARPVRSS